MNPSVDISIITPVYNTEPYLAECIESILDQTFTDFELLLIDDGSQDHSWEICEHYAKTDSRIRIFRQANSGVSATRNKGLAEACGRRITFIDSDDRIGRNWLQSFHDNMEESDFVVQGYTRWEKEKKERICPHPRKSDQITELLVILEKMQGTPIRLVWNKLFDIRLIREHNLRFNEKVPYGEDFLFTLQYVSYCHQICISDCCSYYYRILPSSLARKEYPLQKKSQYFSLILDAASELTQLHSSNKFYHFLRKRFYQNLITDTFFYRVSVSEIDYKNLKEAIRINQHFQSMKKGLWKLPSASIYNKVKHPIFFYYHFVLKALRKLRLT